MAKNKETDVTSKEYVEELNALPTNRPELVTETTPLNSAVQANNWQPNSPAADFRYGNSDNGAVNLVAEWNKEEKEPEKKKQESLTEAEYKRRTELSVADPQFINADLDHYKVK